MNATKKLSRSEMAPAAILDGKITDHVALPDGWTVEAIVEPITLAEGPENCGSGPVTVTGGRLRATKSYYVRYYDASGAGRWWNYGAPHGTHVQAAITWTHDPRIQSGGAGHTIDGRFPRANERITEAGRVEVVS